MAHFINRAGHLKMLIAVMPFFLLNIAAANAGSHKPSDKTAYYDVYGKSYFELAKSIFKNGPGTNRQKVVLAKFVVDVDIQYYMRQGNICTVKEVKSTGPMTTILPRLTDSRVVPKDVRLQFMALQTILKNHEGTHRSIFLKCLQRIRRGIMEMPNLESCNSQDREIGKLIEQIDESCMQQHAALDERDVKKIPTWPVIRQAQAEAEKMRKEGSPLSQFSLGSAATSLRTASMDYSRQR